LIQLHWYGESFDLMIASYRKLLVALFLALASLFQGWPLLAAASCNMAEAMPSVMPDDCCCCETKDQAASAVFTTCTPGDDLVGVLQTDASWLALRDKQVDGGVALTIASTHSLAQVSASSAELSSLPLVIPRSSARSSPIFLLDCVFRV